MGVGANSSGNKSLNDRKERGAGRQKDRGPTREAIEDAGGITPGKGRGRAGGADGRDRRPSYIVDGDRPATAGDIANVKPAAKRTRKKS